MEHTCSHTLEILYKKKDVRLLSCQVWKGWLCNCLILFLLTIIVLKGDLPACYICCFYSITSYEPQHVTDNNSNLILYSGRLQSLWILFAIKRHNDLCPTKPQTSPGNLNGFVETVTFTFESPLSKTNRACSHREVKTFVTVLWVWPPLSLTWGL